MMITSGTTTAVICTKILASKTQCSVLFPVANNRSNKAVPREKVSVQTISWSRGQK